jgi:hypothetical protein
MKTKNKIGILIVLGGIAFIGYTWMKKNKSNVGSSQLKGLQALSKFYNAGIYDIGSISGETVAKPKQSISIGSFMSTQQKNEINNQTNLAIACSIPYIAQRDNIDCTEYCKLNPNNCSATYTSQMTENLKNADFSNLSSLGLAGLTFDNIKIK